MNTIARIRRFFRPRRSPMLRIVMGDITRQNVDVIVNAAKTTLLGGGGVDGAIHTAGGPAILAACRVLRAGKYPKGLPVGEAVATVAGRLPATWVVHTVGPVYVPFPHPDRSEELRNAYRSSLAVADELGAESVAFPLISSGVYGWPTADAILKAYEAIIHSRTKVKFVRLVLWDEDTYRLAQRVLAAKILPS